MHAHRRHGRIVQFALRRIERYRASGLGANAACRFTPSCSRYAEEALRARRLPIAVLLILWRLLRCNPFMHRRVADPVRRTRRWHPRPNTLPTVFSILALSGFVVVVTAGVAQAVGVSGGCRVLINRHDPSTLTRTHPLVVHQGENIGVVGSIPSTVRNPGQEASNTHIKVDIIQGIGSVSSSDHPGHGPFWGGTQNIESYISKGVGLFHVKGVATGTSGWSCSGDAYVEIKDGNPLSKPIGEAAGGLIVVGLLGAAYASTAPEPTADTTASSSSPSDTESARPLGLDPEEDAEDMMRSNDDYYWTMGCLLFLLLAISGGYLFSGTGGALFASRVGRKSSGRLIRSHGHPIVGFISGLLMGLGTAVLLQQFAVWTLTIASAIVFPVVVAIICSLRAWLGRSYRMVPRRS